MLSQVALLVIFKSEFLPIRTCSGKSSTLDFCHNFYECGPIFIENYISVIETSTSPEVCCHTTLWNFKIQNNPTITSTRNTCI